MTERWYGSVETVLVWVEGVSGVETWMGASMGGEGLIWVAKHTPVISCGCEHGI